MSDSSNRMIRYEEDNWQKLAEAFIKKYEDKWIDFVDEQYQKDVVEQEPPDYDDDYHGEDKGYE